MTVWWFVHRVIHYSYLKPSETINTEKYCTEIQQMHEKLCEKQPALVNRHGVLLLQDNAQPHTSKTKVKN